MASFWSRVTMGVRAFRAAYLSSGASGEFSAWDARRLRYDILWALHENTAYGSVQSWSTAYKAEFGLYTHTRGVYNPAYRLASFWSTHLMGGMLDPQAGDGTLDDTALPILTDNEALRPALATLWRDSNWGFKKDVYTLRGAVLGDTALLVVDDMQRRKVYLTVLHPGVLREVIYDPFGNVKRYIIEEPRAHPVTGQAATYREVVQRDGDDVLYQTFLNDTPFAWPGQIDAQGNARSAWREPYGFIPLVTNQHHDVGVGWGWSEYHPALVKIREADDLASKLDDQIRKLVAAPWLFGGVTAPRNGLVTTGASDLTVTEQRRLAAQQADREEIPALYGPLGATATPLVAPLDIAATSTHLQSLLADLERDYPELRYDRLRASGDASAKALRYARQPAEAKVQARRAGYDHALVRAQQMALAIGGLRGYDGYQGFDLDSYAAGQLDHQIGKRPVFSVDTLDDLEEQTLFWANAKAATDSGYSLPLYLQDAGWSRERIAALTAVSPPPGSASVFTIGDRVRVTIPPHMPGQSTGTIALVEGTAYGIVFDGLEDSGVYKWYTAAEVELVVNDAPVAAAASAMEAA